MKLKQTKTRGMILALAILLATPALILCQTGYKNSKNAGSEQEVRKTIDNLATALGKNDTAALDRIYADDYTFVGDTGTMMSKAERIASFKSGDVKYESVSIEVARMHIFGDTAVAVTHIKTKFAPYAKVTGGKFVTTATFVKIKGRWQLVAAGNTRVAE